MKFKFKDRERADELVQLINRRVPDRRIKIVHVCGTHEVAITENGLRSLLPDRIDIREGPGCPVCVTPTSDLDAALKLAERGAIITAFGDMMNVPGTAKSLNELKSEGGDVRLVYSVSEGAKIAENTEKQVVFLGVGFETTTPMTAAILKDDPPENFSILPSNKLIPPAMKSLLELPDNDIDGFIAPGHVSTIIGVRPYESLAEEYGVPIVVGGFEPLDILYALALIMNQISNSDPKAENGYNRAVDHEGNPKSKKLIKEVFKETDATWRGIGTIPNSGLTLNRNYEEWNALNRFEVEPEEGIEEPPNCLCPQVITARATPGECELFKEKCTPSSPYGPCMVGEEAMCNIWYRYGGRPKL
ncbi:hydrogenase formation protein HypD [Candidatus Bipolaricaulota bacterium]|nr:hydrogenase formation protein HypD [Candidatus Bipolaricaulota bacterium]